MEMYRRNLLAGGLVYVGVAGLPCTVQVASSIGTFCSAIDQEPPPFTRSLLEGAFQGGKPSGPVKIERFIRQRTEKRSRSTDVASSIQLNDGHYLKRTPYA
jgi:hypothetical protein